MCPILREYQINPEPENYFERDIIINEQSD